MKHLAVGVDGAGGAALQARSSVMSKGGGSPHRVIVQDGLDVALQGLFQGLLDPRATRERDQPRELDATGSVAP